MASISALGIGSGLDLNGLLDQLQEAERGKLVPIVRQQEQQQAKISAYGQLQSMLTQLQDAAAKLNDPKLYESLLTQVIGGEGLVASASAEAHPGRYEVAVTQAARAGTLATQRVDASDEPIVVAVEGEELPKLELTFAGSEETIKVDVSSGDTLEDIRDAINAHEDAGVTASIINDGTGYRLALNSKETGADAAITKTNFADLAKGSLMDEEPGEEIIQKGQDAKFKLNGVEITSSSNSIEGAIQGVALTIEPGMEEGSTFTVAVEQDTRAVREAVTDFVDSFNDLKETIGSLTAFNAESGVAGELNGDSMVRTIESRMRGILSGGVSGGEFYTLSQVGISLQRDGTLELDGDQLDELVTGNMAELGKFFAGTGETTGMAGMLDTSLGQMLGTNGLVENTISGAESRIESLNERYARMERSIEQTIARYRTQFGQLDSMIAQMNQTSEYLTQQFDMMNAQLGRK